ncbi:TetR/AcrR family transcriptional regulator [Acidaminobacter sp. JC074]|uniref:TetR/AcrR family transcriptional regulator n=1 Tax=Acidaminobacter sp. JC074 TaxID=2530199 RepID=UPI001F10E0BA|nr:TetR/AcrR family transcriptional regulator [Acidaminobacter sp. JC074]MCH4886018.1 TetR/AcrR family transcriptional regulator [Acidaminobacter sp. JC074]
MARKTETRNKIMKVALKLFSEQGYYATPTKLIAQEAGVNELTLFRHFGTKEKLFQETTENYVKDLDLTHDIDELINESFEDSMLGIARNYLQFCFDNEQIYKIQMRLHDDEQEFVRLKLSRELSSVLSDYFTILLNKQVINGKPDMMAVTFINSILGAYTVYLMTGDSFTDLNIHDLVDEHARQFVAYYKV